MLWTDLNGSFFSYTTTYCVVFVIATQPCYKYVQHKICHSILKHVKCCNMLWLQLTVYAETCLWIFLDASDTRMLHGVDWFLGG